MTRWISIALLGAVGAVSGCSDDSTGGGGSGGTGNVDGCGGPGECGDEQRCQFRDGLCGAGERGTCVPRSEVCSDGDEICLCDGTVGDGDSTCDDIDVDASGSCALPAESFACAARVCSVGQRTFCRITSDDTGGAPFGGCNQTEEPTCDDVPTCACLAVEIEACGGTCEDGDGGATVRCPGG